MHDLEQESEGRSSKLAEKMMGALVIGGLLIPSAAFSGCFLLVGGAAGAAAATYVAGELQVTDNVSFERATQSAQRAIAQLDYTAVGESKDEVQAEYGARMADGRKVSIRLERLGENVTKVGIRVGTFGDESKSQLVLEKMRNNY